MSDPTTTYGVLGVGSIASAIVTGLCRSDEAPPVVLSPRGAARAQALAGRFPTVRVADDNQGVVDAADVVLVCLRRADTGALDALRFGDHHTVVSAVPGLALTDLAGRLGPATVVRAVPMPAVATRAGTTPLFPAHPVSTALFERLGTPLPLPTEAAFDALSTASATVATHFAFLDAVARWLGDHGVPADDAQRYLAVTYADVDLGGGEVGFRELAAEHATPGGVNEQVELTLREAGFFDQVGAALETVHRRVNG